MRLAPRQPPPPALCSKKPPRPRLRRLHSAPTIRSSTSSKTTGRAPSYLWDESLIPVRRVRILRQAHLLHGRPPQRHEKSGRRMGGVAAIRASFWLLYNTANVSAPTQTM